MKHIHELSVLYRDLGDVRPSSHNARMHTRGQIAQIAASIQEFGFTNPILVDEDQTLIAGHGRLAASARRP
jgi:ParB-like chromosome segregation protein Spo0J